MISKREEGKASVSKANIGMAEQLPIRSVLRVALSLSPDSSENNYNAGRPTGCLGKVVRVRGSGS